MLQLNQPLSAAEAELLIQCLNDMIDAVPADASSNKQYFVKHTALLSAKQKLQSQTYDCFYREEITSMVFALDKLCRKCSSHLAESLSPEQAADIGKHLFLAATTRAKLKKVKSHLF